jgi:hypothetical protein
MESGILHHGSKVYKIIDGKVYDKKGLFKPWKPLPKFEADKILKVLKDLKNSPTTKVYFDNSKNK